jgi:hypothetical protein
VSVSLGTSGSSVTKKTREPSSDVRTNEAASSPLPLI